MTLKETQCCAIQEIAHLSDHASAEEAMEAFCGLLTESHNDFYNDTSSKKFLPLAVPGLITFSGVVGFERGSSSGRGNISYGPNFKAFILRHGLGAVSESPLTTNRLNHPERKIKAWMWRPHVKNLTAWWHKRSDAINPDYSPGA